MHSGIYAYMITYVRPNKDNHRCKESFLSATCVTFDIVQNLMKGRARTITTMGEMPVLSRMLYRADCGKKLYVCRTKSLKPEAYYYCCSTYRKRKGECFSHQILIKTIDKIVLDDINEHIAFAKEHEDEFAKLVSTKSQSESASSLKALNKRT